MTTPSIEVTLSCPGSTPQVTGAMPVIDQDAGQVRLQQVMARARRGENIVIAGLGGSITNGDRARGEKRYISQVYEWWNEKFPGQVRLINAGLGATGSGMGVHRIEKDLLDENPDFIMVDFAVNDLGIASHQATLEGVVRKILSQPNQPAVMLVYFAVKSGATTQADFEPIAEHYQLAQVSYGDRIRQLVDAGEITLDDVFADDVHPNTLGHTYAADFIKEYLDSVYNSLPADIPMVVAIPDPLVTDTFQYTQVLNQRTFEPVITGDWTEGHFNRHTGAGWIGGQVGDELIFEGLLGTTFGIMFKQDGNVDNGMVEVWVDDESPMKVDGYLPSSAGWYGPAPQFYLVVQGLPMTTHTLHVRIIDEKHPETGDNTNHVFELANVFVDGALVDHLDDWHYIYTRSGDFDFHPVNTGEGDRATVSPAGDDPAEIVWHYRNFTDFEAVFHEVPEDEAQRPAVCVSADGLIWTVAEPEVESDATMTVYRLGGVTEANYVKIVWGNPQGALGQVTIMRAEE